MQDRLTNLTKQLTDIGRTVSQVQATIDPVLSAVPTLLAQGQLNAGQIAQLQQNIGNVTSTLTAQIHNVQSTVQSSLQQTTELTRDQIAGIQQNLANVTSAVTQLGDIIPNTVASQLHDVHRVLNETLAQSGQLTARQIADIQQNLGNVTTSLTQQINSVQSNLQTSLQQTTQLTRDQISGIEQNLVNMTGTVAQLGDIIPSTVAQQIQDVHAALNQTLTQSGQLTARQIIEIQQNIGNVTQSIQSIQQLIPGAVADQIGLFEGQLNTAMQLTSNLTAAQIIDLTHSLGNVSTAITGAQQAIAQSMIQQIGTFQSTVNTALQQSNQATMDHITMLQQNIQNVTSSLGGQIQAIESTVQGSLQQASQLTSAQINTMQANLNNVSNSLGQMQQLFPSTINNQFGIFQGQVSALLQQNNNSFAGQISELMTRVNNVSTIIANSQQLISDSFAREMSSFQATLNGTLLQNNNVTLNQIRSLQQNLGNVSSSIALVQQMIPTAISQQMASLQSQLNATILQNNNVTLGQLADLQKNLGNVSNGIVLVEQMIPSIIGQQMNALQTQLNSISSYISTLGKMISELSTVTLAVTLPPITPITLPPITLPKLFDQEKPEE